MRAILSAKFCCFLWVACRPRPRARQGKLGLQRPAPVGDACSPVQRAERDTTVTGSDWTEGADSLLGQSTGH